MNQLKFVQLFRTRHTDKYIFNDKIRKTYNITIFFQNRQTRTQNGMYFGEIGSLPAPFNILLIGNIASFIRKRCCKKGEGKVEDTRQKNLKENIESEKGDKYKVQLKDIFNIKKNKLY